MSSRMLRAHVEGIGCIGPGFDDWPATRALLRGDTPYASRPTNLPAPALLPASERRRASRAIKVALAAGGEAVAMTGRDASTLLSVFSASAGDGSNCHELCQQLATDDRQISPTRFHNSVHNAPAGYWGIATGAMATSSVLCAYDASFGAGLLEAMAQVVTDRMPVVLVVYDTDYPEPLWSVRPVPDALGVALVLAPEPSPRSLATIEVALAQATADTLPDPALETLRATAPAARALPLLAALATLTTSSAAAPHRVMLDYLDGTRLAIAVGPPRT